MDVLGIVIYNEEDLGYLEDDAKAEGFYVSEVLNSPEWWNQVERIYGTPIVMYVDLKTRLVTEFDRPEHVTCPVREAEPNSKIYETFDEYWKAEVE